MFQTCIGSLCLLLPTNFYLSPFRLASFLAANLVGLVIGVPAILAAVVFSLAQRPVNLCEGSTEETEVTASVPQFGKSGSQDSAPYAIGEPVQMLYLA